MAPPKPDTNRPGRTAAFVPCPVALVEPPWEHRPSSVRECSLRLRPTPRRAITIWKIFDRLPDMFFFKNYSFFGVVCEFEGWIRRFDGLFLYSFYHSSKIVWEWLTEALGDGNVPIGAVLALSPGRVVVCGSQGSSANRWKTGFNNQQDLETSSARTQTKPCNNSRSVFTE